MINKMKVLPSSEHQRHSFILLFQLLVDNKSFMRNLSEISSSIFHQNGMFVYL